MQYMKMYNDSIHNQCMKMCNPSIHNHVNSASSSVTPDKYTDNLAATVLGDQVKPWQGVLIEAWITCMLVITIIGSTNMRRKGELYMATIPIGFAVTLGIMSAVSIQLISDIYSDDRLNIDRQL